MSYSSKCMITNLPILGGDQIVAFLLSGAGRKRDIFFDPFPIQIFGEYSYGRPSNIEENEFYKDFDFTDSDHRYIFIHREIYNNIISHGEDYTIRRVNEAFDRFKFYCEETDFKEDNLAMYGMICFGDTLLNGRDDDIDFGDVIKRYYKTKDEKYKKIITDFVILNDYMKNNGLNWYTHNIVIDGIEWDLLKKNNEFVTKYLNR